MEIQHAAQVSADHSLKNMTCSGRNELIEDDFDAAWT